MGRDVKPPYTSRTSTAEGWENIGGIISPLDSLTIIGDGQFNVTWEVLGRDVGGGGLP